MPGPVTGTAIMSTDTPTWPPASRNRGLIDLATVGQVRDFRGSRRDPDRDEETLRQVRDRHHVFEVGGLEVRVGDEQFVSRRAGRRSDQQVAGVHPLAVVE